MCRLRRRISIRPASPDTTIPDFYSGVIAMDIILASGSPRRRELLEQMGIRHYRVVTPDVDEHMEGHPAPAALVETLSRRKAEAVGERVGNTALVIAADTVVALEETILGKPHSREEAAAMLAALSGREHRAYIRPHLLHRRHI